MKDDRKFQLHSGESIEDALATYFKKVENQKMLFQHSLASLIIDWGKDGTWLQKPLNMDKNGIDAIYEQVELQLPSLPPKDEEFLESLIEQDNDKLSAILMQLNRPGITDKEERLRNIWASNSVNRWRLLSETGELKRQNHSEQHYATMIMAYLIDGYLDSLRTCN